MEVTKPGTWTFIEVPRPGRTPRLVSRTYSPTVISIIRQQATWNLLLSTTNLIVRERDTFVQIFIRNEMLQ